MKLLDGKWIVITGASKGLGREMALVFAAAGGNLILTARSGELETRTGSWRVGE